MAHEYPLCSRLFAEFERPEVLYLAGLFHDIAKGRGGDHSKLGMADARQVLQGARAVEAGHRTGGLAGRATSHHVGNRAEAGPVRPGRDRRICRKGGRRSPPGGAVSADRRGHTRHQPEGLERVEGQTSRRLVPGHAPVAQSGRAARRKHACRRARSGCWRNCAPTRFPRAPIAISGISSTIPISCATTSRTSSGTRGCSTIA